MILKNKKAEGGAGLISYKLIIFILVVLAVVVGIITAVRLGVFSDLFNQLPGFGSEEKKASTTPSGEVAVPIEKFFSINADNKIFYDSNTQTEYTKLYLKEVVKDVLYLIYRDKFGIPRVFIEKGDPVGKIVNGVISFSSSNKDEIMKKLENYQFNTGGENRFFILRNTEIKSSCADITKPVDPGNSGFVTYNSEKKEDTCLSLDSVSDNPVYLGDILYYTTASCIGEPCYMLEYFCSSPEKLDSKLYHCKSGCNQGACTKSAA